MKIVNYKDFIKQIYQTGPDSGNFEKFHSVLNMITVSHKTKFQKQYFYSIVKNNGFLCQGGLHMDGITLPADQPNI